MIFAIVSIYVSKNEIMADSIDASKFKIKIDDKEYSRLGDDAFLTYHNYNVFTSSSEVNISSRGTLGFEIPEDYLNASTIGWAVENGIICSQPYMGQATEVPIEANIVEQQSAIEEYMLTKYNNMGKASIDDPYVELNPYEIAPLSALVMFETESASDVMVTVKGKSGAKDFTYTLSNKVTHHEVPIIGLYAEYRNQVILQAGNQTKTIEIQTTSLPSDMEKPIMNTTTDSVVLENGFVFMAGNYRMLVDSMGEIRWYATIQAGADPSGIDFVSANEGIWYSINPYISGSSLYHLSWLGKIQNNIIGAGSAHHDIEKISDTEYLYWSGNFNLMKLDLAKQKTEVFLDVQTLLDWKFINLEMRQDYVGEWCHPNTVSFLDGYLYLSFRNQHMVLKMDYATKEIIWVVTPASGKDENGKTYAIQEDVVDQIVLPADDDEDFEWFYSQHEIVPLPDIDNNPDTDDFTLFDNGQERGVYGWYDGMTSSNDFYSRIVHYRVNNETKTIEQIFDYGKGVTPSLSTKYYGGAQYISEQGQTMYLGCFGMLDFANGTQYGDCRGSKIIAVSDSGEQKCMWYFPNGCTYRAHYLSMSDFSAISAPALGTPGKAIYESNNSWTSWTEPEDNQAVRYEVTELTQQQDGKVSLSGWAYLENDKEHARNVYFVAKNAENAYKINLIQRDGMIPEDELVTSRQGFYDRSVNMNELPDGEYELGLQVESNGMTGYVALPYTITVGEEILEVENDDILVKQQSVDTQLLAAGSSEIYSLQNPFVSINPYGISPLTAIAVFKTDQEAKISVSVESKNGAVPIVNEFETMGTEHVIPIYGLYSDEATNVTLTATYADGTNDSKTVSLTGGALPADFQPVEVVPGDTDTAQMADGWTFLMAGSLQGYVYAIDENGAVRWMLSEKGLGAASVFLPLDNGNYLIGGDKSFGNYYKYNLFELDLTGHIVHEYLINGYHHDAVELPSGNLLLLANNINGQVMEDTLYELDRETGEILRTWDFNSYFDVGNYNEDGQHIADVNYGTGASDWLHINGIDYDAQTNALLISSRHQDAVFSMDLGTGEINWILSDPNDLWPEYLKDKLLTPVGDGFEWQYGQHNSIWLPDGNIMLFDNGDYRSKTQDGVLDAATQSYSRAVIYHVDEVAGTVSQEWQFGKEKGTDHFAVNVSSVQYLGENHYLIDFGGIVKNSAGEATYSIMDGITGSSRSEVYEIKNGTVVFHANVSRSGLYGNTFRAVRLLPYTATEELDLTVAADRLGSLYSYGLATEINFDSANAISGSPKVTVTDNGIQLLIAATLDNSAVGSAMVFAGTQGNYRVALPDGSNLWYTINKSEIPVGTYRLYLEYNAKYYDLALQWTNMLDARPYPSGYDVKVITSSDGKGSVYGGGTYYADTPFTISVKPNNGAEFIGWYVNGTLLSTSSTYSLTATANMTLTATFAGDESGSQQGGGAGGGGSEVIDKPSISVNGSGGMATTDDDGTVIITPDAGYQIAKITVNGEEVVIPADGKLIGLDANDKVVVTFEKATASVPFTDVVDNAWYVDAVKYVYENNIMNGTDDDSFSPEMTTTRGMIVTMLHRIENEPTATASGFEDVTAGAWYADAVAWAAANGVVNGVSETAFAPNSPITREQLVAILYRYAKFKGYDLSGGEETNILSYADSDQISEYAIPAMQWACSAGLLTGNTETTLNPQGNATRAEVATILMRLCESVENGVAS